MIGVIEAAVRESRGVQGAADQDQRGARDALSAQLGADRGERAADDALVRPGRRDTTTAGQSAPHTGASSRTIRARLLIER